MKNDVAVNKRNEDQGYVFCVWLFSCNDSMSVAVRKWFPRQNVIYRLEWNVQRIVDVNVRVKNTKFNIPLILDNNKIMIGMQKFKIYAGIYFSFYFNLECLHSSLQEKLLAHNCARAQKHVFVPCKGF